MTFALRWIMNGTKSSGIEQLRSVLHGQLARNSVKKLLRRRFWQLWTMVAWIGSLLASVISPQFCLVSAKFTQSFARRIFAGSRASACTIWKMIHHLLTLYAHKAFRARKLRQFSGPGKYILIICHLDWASHVPGEGESQNLHLQDQCWESKGGQNRAQG